MTTNKRAPSIYFIYCGKVQSHGYYVNYHHSHPCNCCSCNLSVRKYLLRICPYPSGVPVGVMKTSCSSPIFSSEENSTPPPSNFSSDFTWSNSSLLTADVVLALYHWFSWTGISWIKCKTRFSKGKNGAYM